MNMPLLRYRNLQVSVRGSSDSSNSSLDRFFSSSPSNLNGIAAAEAPPSSEHHGEPLIACVQGPQGGEVTVLPALTKVSTGAPVTQIGFGPVKASGTREGDSLPVLCTATQSETLLWDLSSSSSSLSSHPSSITLGCSGDNHHGLFAFHPSCPEVIATGGLGEHQSVVSLWNLHHPNEPLLSDSTQPRKLRCISWSGVGDRLATVDDTGALELVDLRAKDTSRATRVAAHQGAGGCPQVNWDMQAESNGYIVTTGANAMREREMILWDPRSLRNAADRVRVGGAAGIKPLLPLTTPNSGLLTLCCRGDSNIRAFELRQGKLESLCNTSLGMDSGIWHCLLPPTTCNHKEAEIARIVRILGNGNLQNISMSATRKDLSRLHEDLYPPVPTQEQDFPVDDWLKGEDRLPHLLPAFAQKRATDESPATAAPPEAETAAPAMAPVTVSDEVLQSEADSVARTAHFRASTTAKFKNIYAEEWPLSEQQTGIRLPRGSAADSPLLACSTKLWAVPWEGGGGPIYIGIHGRNCGGKIEPNTCCLNSQRAPVRSICFSPLDPHLMASGSEDSTVALWKIPEGGRIVGDESPISVIADNSHAVKQLCWHPFIKGLLMTSSGCNTVRLFDVTSSSSSGRQIFKYEHGTSINAACFSPCGSLIATATRDGKINLLDARDAIAEVTRSGGGGGVGGGPRHVCTWWGQLAVDLVVTSGFGGASLRQIFTWDPRMMNAPLSTVPVDYANGLLHPFFNEAVGMIHLAARGDRQIKSFEMVDSTPTVCPDFKASGAPLAGLGFVPPSSQTLDVMDCEVGRLLRLDADGNLLPVSFFLPRAKELKDYFQDDIYRSVIAGGSSSNESDGGMEEVNAWLAGETVTAKLCSLMPQGVKPLSKKPPTPKGISKAVLWRQQMELEKKEEEQVDAEFQRLTALANQNATYNPNLSMGRGGGVVGARVDEQCLDSQDVSDSEWDD